MSPFFKKQHYSDRTWMAAYALITGDLNLILKEPQLLIVRLQVTERPTFPPWLYPMLAVCLALAVAALGWYTTITVSSVVVNEGVCFEKLPYKTMAPLPEDVTVEWSPCALEPMRVHEYCNVPQEVVKVGDQATCVTLPFKTRARLPADATVKWKRFELYNSSTVHVYQNGQDMSEVQHDSYRGRTKMRENPLQAGDLSLTLINPSHEDIGVYSCTVERDGDVIWKRSVRLKLKGIAF